jgi:hypothetical protein
MAAAAVSTEYGFFRTHAYQDARRISLTGYIRIDLAVWPNSTACNITARENRFRWTEGGTQIANAEAAFSLPVVALPGEEDDATQVSTRDALAWLGLLAVLLLLLLIGGSSRRATPSSS